MKVGKIEILSIRPQQGLIEFVNLEVDGELLLRSIGIHKKLNGTGYRLTYPTRGRGEDALTLYHPITRKLSMEIEESIFDKAKKTFYY